MKVLVIGLGSMGTRRIKALRQLGVEDIYIYDLNPARVERARAVLGSAAVGVMDAGGLDITLGEVDAVMISTPPHQHNHLIRMARERNQPTFVEAGIFKRPLGGRLFPSATLRLHPAVSDLRDIAIERTPLMLTHHCGHYLPRWHPEEPVTHVYYSKRDTGPCREMLVFELGWLTHIFGSVVNITGNALYSGTIPGALDIADAYIAAVRFASGTIGSLVIDVLSPYTRHLRIIERDGRDRSWVNLESTLTNNINLVDERPSRVLEQVYVDETQHFLRAIRGEEDWINPCREDQHVLEALERFEHEAGLIDVL